LGFGNRGKTGAFPGVRGRLETRTSSQPLLTGTNPANWNLFAGKYPSGRTYDLPALQTQLFAAQGVNTHSKRPYQCLGTAAHDGKQIACNEMRRGAV
jgi:hypothetical protein